MPDKKKKKPPPKKKDNKSSKSNQNKSQAAIEKLAKICRIIAIFDLLHALYFTVRVMIDLAIKFSGFGMLALFGVMFWVVVVILLIVGLWKRRPKFVRYWLIFSIGGFIADVLFMLWGLATSITVDWDRLGEFVIVFLGIFIESACIYLIHRYYQIMIGVPDKLCCNKKKSNKKSNKDNKKSRKK